MNQCTFNSDRGALWRCKNAFNVLANRQQCARFDSGLSTWYWNTRYVHFVPHLHEGSIDLGTELFHCKERAPNVVVDDVLIHILQILPCTHTYIHTQLELTSRYYSSFIPKLSKFIVWYLSPYLRSRSQELDPVSQCHRTVRSPLRSASSLAPPNLHDGRLGRWQRKIHSYVIIVIHHCLRMSMPHYFDPFNVRVPKEFIVMKISFHAIRLP